MPVGRWLRIIGCSHQVVISPKHALDGLGTTQALRGDVEVLDAEKALGGHHRGFADERQRGSIVFGHPEIFPSGESHPVVRRVHIAHASCGQRGLAVRDRRSLRRCVDGALRLFEEQRLRPLEFSGVECNHRGLEQRGIAVLDFEIEFDRVLVAPVLGRVGRLRGHVGPGWSGKRAQRGSGWGPTQMCIRRRRVGLSQGSIRHELADHPALDLSMLESSTRWDGYLRPVQNRPEAVAPPTTDTRRRHTLWQWERRSCHPVSPAGIRRSRPPARPQASATMSCKCQAPRSRYPEVRT